MSPFEIIAGFWKFWNFPPDVLILNMEAGRLWHHAAFTRKKKKKNTETQQRMQ